MHRSSNAQREDASEIKVISARTVSPSSDRIRTDPDHLYQSLQPTDPRQEPRIRAYLLLIYNYRTLICGVAAAVVFFALLKSLLTTPMYRAEATLRIGTYTPALQGNAREDYVAQQTRELGYLNTQIELLTSLPVADLVLADPNGLAAEIKRYDDRYRAPEFSNESFRRLKQPK